MLTDTISSIVIDLLLKEQLRPHVLYASTGQLGFCLHHAICITCLLERQWQLVSHAGSSGKTSS